MTPKQVPLLQIEYASYRIRKRTIQKGDTGQLTGLGYYTLESQLFWAFIFINTYQYNTLKR